jgi:hypothetical protein
VIAADEWVERFASPTLDPRRWIASYLPAWSSRAAAAAAYAVEDDGLHLGPAEVHAALSLQSGNSSSSVPST